MAGCCSDLICYSDCSFCEAIQVQPYLKPAPPYRMFFRMQVGSSSLNACSRGFALSQIAGQCRNFTCPLKSIRHTLSPALCERVRKRRDDLTQTAKRRVSREINRFFRQQSSQSHQNGRSPPLAGNCDSAKFSSQPMPTMGTNPCASSTAFIPFSSSSTH